MLTVDTLFNKKSYSQFLIKNNEDTVMVLVLKINKANDEFAWFTVVRGEYYLAMFNNLVRTVSVVNGQCCDHAPIDSPDTKEVVSDQNNETLEQSLTEVKTAFVDEILPWAQTRLSIYDSAENIALIVQQLEQKMNEQESD